MAHCSACEAEVAPGNRWCSICHTNVVNPAIGRLAPPRKRLAAYLLDLLAPFAALFVILGIGGLGAQVGSKVDAEAATNFGLILTFAAWIAYVVWALVLFARGTTPGKSLLGMRVVKEDGSQPGFFTMLVREWVGKWISAVIFGLGFL